MTKSDGEPVNDLVQSIAEEIRERLLPQKGAEFIITYYAGEMPVKYGEESYTWVNAASEGLRVVCDTDKARVSHLRQKKPITPEFLWGEDGAYRRALCIALGGNHNGNDADYYLYILGNLIVVAETKLRVAQLVGDQSLTEKDAEIMHQLRKKTETHGT
jgi:hypothetical protein